MALAVIHHLTITQWQSFERVVTLLAGLTRRWLVLEWVPLTDDKTRLLLGHGREDLDWYRLDNLLEVVRQTFPQVEVLDSFPEGRQLIVASR